MKKEYQDINCNVQLFTIENDVITTSSHTGGTTEGPTTGGGGGEIGGDVWD